MAQQIQIRRDTAATWASVDPVPAQGEMCYATDTGVLKIGDGTGTYSALAAFSAGGGGGGGATNLTWTPATSIVASDTGTDATLTAADGTNPGLMTSAQFTKLAAIEALADVTDATNVAAAGAVMNSGASTIGGVKTFSSVPLVPDEVYGVAWNGSLGIPTKNAVYDQIQSLVVGAGNVATDVIFDAKGDLVVGSAPDAAIRLGVGTNGQVLTADSATASGLAWAAAAGGGNITAGPTAPVAPSIGDLWADTSATWLPVDSVNGATGAVSITTASIQAINVNQVGVSVQAFSPHLQALNDAANSAVLAVTTASYTTALNTKLDAIEALADVTDAANVAAAGAVMLTLVDVKGDLFVGSAADTLVRLGVGTNGQVLTANSATASGLEWTAPGGGAQTPWASNVDAAGFTLSDVPVINMASFAMPATVQQFYLPGINTAVTGNRFSAQFGAPVLAHGTTVAEVAAINVAAMPSRNVAGTTTVSAGFNVNVFAGVDDAAGSVNTESIGFRAKMGPAGNPPTTMIGFGAEMTTGFTTVATAVGVDVKSSVGAGAITQMIGLRINNLNSGTDKWGMQIGDFSSWHHGRLRLGGPGGAIYGLELNNIAQNRGVFYINPSTTPPSQPALANFGAGMYTVGDKFVLFSNDNGTMRYKYLSMATATVTWVHTEIAPT